MNNNEKEEDYNLLDELEIKLNDIFQKIAECPLIDNKEYNILMNFKKKNKASEFDKIKLAKK